MDTMGTIYEHRSRSVASNGHKGACPFDMSDEDEDNDKGDAPGRVGGGFRSVGTESSEAGPAESGKRSLPANGGATSCNAPNRRTSPCAQPNDHGSANAMVRARMLLDIADIVPWGMANRHLVSAADLGLATLLNVAAQACPESVEGGGGVAADVAAGGESVDEEFSTQGSMGSQSEPGSVIGALANGQANGSDASSANNNAGVMPELSRLAPTGFLLPLVVGATAVLADLSVASLRSLHQLLLALRLLDLATLESSGEGDGAAAKATAGATTPPRESPSHPYAELTGALLLVVAECQPFCSDGVPARHHRKGKAPDRIFGDGVNEQPTGSQQPVVGTEVAAKVHECLLAALRVLINVTHHDARVCAEVAAKRGLEALMRCLARSCCGSQGGDSDGSSRGPLIVRAKSDVDLLGDVVNEANETIPETGLEEDGNGEEAGSGAGDFDAQVLAMSALINCVELKESADNCAAMASLAVHPPDAWAAGGKAFAGDSKKQWRPLPGVGDGRCLAPEFLAKLLTLYTRNFAHQLEVDRPGENDDDERPVSRPPSGTAQHGGGVMAGGSSAAAPATHSIPSPVAVTPQKGDNGEQSMSHAEGTDLVLGGHCALLLGLLVRDQERNRRLALPVLPNGDPTLIVRVLEAFMALQFQAGVLTEELVLAVQGLVEELEGLDALPAEEGDPFEPVADEEPASVATCPAAAAASVSAAATTRQRRGQKRPRGPPSNREMPPVDGILATLPSGLSGVEAGGGDDGNANDFSLSVKSSRTAAQEESASSLLMTQPPSEDATPPPKRSKPSEASSPSPPLAAASEEERQATATPNKSPSATSESAETPASRSQTPGSTKKSPSSWRAGITSIAERIGLGFRGRSAAGSKSWFGSGPKLQSFRNRSAYGSQTWRKASSRSLTGSSHSSPSYGQAGEGAAAELTAGRGVKPSRNVFEFLSDESEVDLQDASPVGGAASGIGGGGVGPRSDRSGAVEATVSGAANSITGGGVGSRSGRSSTVAATVGGAANSVAEGSVGPRSGRSSNVAITSSSFDIDNWSDSSNESPGRRKPGEEAKAKGARVATCQLQALGGSRGSARGCGARGGGVSGGGSTARSVFDRRRRRSPSPSPPPAAAPAAGRNHNASRGAAAPSGLPGVAKGGIKTAPATSIAKAKGGVTSTPTEEVGARAKLGGEHGRSAGMLGLANGARPTVNKGDSVRGGRVGGVKPATRRVLGVDGRSKGGAEKPASHNVFEMSDEDESD
ncbi:expressed unknown protein [Ectocarpus siliculosus]|uniref:Wings apart-like protein C-terminal domain-containing protein n=1 Tax=Ectocarpus siliculosus TaxID=2880 RepID=D7FW36_ECTSI|nr:expressed unknown protein [Ectocarpus siliculosus]|eukprot:CBJ25556.1 expressed unknown protein [Ectocarpus siliculosus]